MIKRKRFNDRYWKYYMMLEDRFIRTCQFVELTPDNYDTFSNEYASLLMAIGAEIDVLFKLNCSIDVEERSSIEKYISLQPLVKDIELEVVNREIETVKPFATWDITAPAKSLEWWQAYNKIKHGRGDNRQFASQRNVLFALAALCLLENYMLKKIALEYNCMNVPSEYSKLFYIIGWKYNSVTYNKNEKDLFFQIDETDEDDKKLLDLLRELGWDDVISSIPEE